mgnify:CR=1 FL=1
MAFDSLSEKLQNVFKNLRSKGRLTEDDVKAALKEVKMALLEADVNFKVVKGFIKDVQERAVGQDVMNGLNPGQMVIKIVNEELIRLMGSETTEITLQPGSAITVIMMAGLQGAGKTTTTAKLAGKFKLKGKKPLLVACDVYRPAAIKQLQVLGEQVGIPVFSMGQGNPVDIARGSLEFARSNNRDIIILDTAGRLHINEELMDELQKIKSALNPEEILLVVDAMTGQDAVNVAEAFNQQLTLTGVILTKLDGDTRGGAALSVKAVTGCPIKYVGMGEKLDALEVFFPDRMASRILGMGDVLSLVEKAQATFDEDKAREMERKLRQQEFTLEDFLEQMQQVRSMGPLEDLLSMIPGMGKQLKGMQGQIDEKELAHIEAIIQSMTKEERRNPTIINGSRKKRIARGSGARVQEVNRLLKQFEESRKLMKQFADMGGRKGKRGGMPPIKFPF